MTSGAIANISGQRRAWPALHLLPALPLLALPFAGTDPQTIDQVIVAIEIIFLIMGFRDPLWVLGAIIVSELTVKNYFLDLGGVQISTRLFITVSAFLIAAPVLARPLDLGPRSRPVFLAMAAFVFLSMFASVMYSDMAYVFKFGRFLASGCVATLLFAGLVRTREDLRRTAGIVLVVGLASAIAAVLQHYEFKGAPVYAVVPNNVFPDGLDEWGGRVLGLTEHPVYLTNDLFLLLFPLVAVILLRATPERSLPSFVVLALIVMAALYFTQTRSWVYSAVLGTIVMSLVVRGKRSQELLLVLVIFGGAFWYWSQRTGNRYTLGPESDDSAATRPVLWSAALNIAFDNPLLGVGHDRFLELSPQYAERIDATLMQRQGAGSALGTYTPHNDFLNVWLSFGTLALAAYVSLIWFSASNFVWAYRTFTDPVLGAVSLGLLGTVVASAANAFFHNFFDSTLHIWILAGLSVSLASLAARLKTFTDPSGGSLRDASGRMFRGTGKPEQGHKKSRRSRVDAAKARLKVCLLINDLRIGGAERQLVELATGLDRSRFDPLVVTLYHGQGLETELLRGGVRLLSLNRRGKYDFRPIFRLRSILRRERVDIIQPFLTPATFFGLSASLLAGTPVRIVTERCGLRVNPGVGSSLYRFVEDRLSRFADAAVPNSQAGAAYLMRRGISRNKIWVIYNGVNASRVAFSANEVRSARESLGIPADAPVLGVVASLQEAKDHRTFLDACSRVASELTDAHFVIVGDGELRTALEDMAWCLGIGQRTHFTGNQVRVAPLIACFDVAVLSSCDHEGCSNFILEAMGLGKPVVCTNVGGNPELVRDGENGFTVPPKRPELMADRILTILRDAELARSFGGNGRARFDTEFTLPTMVHAYEKLYVTLWEQLAASDSGVLQQEGVHWA